MPSINDLPQSERVVSDTIIPTLKRHAYKLVDVSLKNQFIFKINIVLIVTLKTTKK